MGGGLGFLTPSFLAGQAITDPPSGAINALTKLILPRPQEEIGAFGLSLVG